MNYPLKIIRWMMPKWYKPGNKRMSYIFTLGWGLFITIILQIIFFVLFYLSDHTIGYIINIVCLLFSFLSIYFLKYTKHTWIAANIIAAIIFLNTTINSYFTGGLNSSILLWMLIIPIIAIFILERKQGLFWVISSLIVLFLFFAFFPNGSSNSITLIENIDFDRWVNLFLLLAVIWFSAVVFDNAKNEAIDDAKKARKEADRNAEELTAELARRKLAEQALRKSEERLSLAIDGANIGLWDWEIASDEMTFNEKFENILGYQHSELENTITQWLALIHPEDRSDVEASIQKHIQGSSPSFRCEYRVRKKDGSWIWVLSSGMVTSRDQEGIALRIVGILSETTDRKLLEEKLKYLANTDALTKVINRRHFFELAEKELERTVRYEIPMSIAIFDVDNFKLINDKFGHLSGDQVLSNLTKRALDIIRDTDILARYGGEEFVILFPHTELEEAFSSSERIREAIAESPFQVRNQEIWVTLSMGVTSYSQVKTENIDILLDRADQALYRSKENGKNKTTKWED